LFNSLFWMGGQNMSIQNIIDAANQIIADAAALEQQPPPPPSTMWPTPIDCLAGIAPVPLPSMVSAEQNIPFYDVRNVEFDRIHPNAPAGSVVFIGDSIMAGMTVSDITPFGLNMGISGDTLRGIMRRLNRMGADNVLHRAGCGVILAGINDLCYPGEWAAGNVQYLYDMFFAQATGKWIIVHILPINESMFYSTTNTRIDAINAYIDTKVAAAPAGVFTVVDVKAQLAPEGQLLPEYTPVGDGCHLSAAGYAILKQAIKNAL
jgi:lysophospholipase L1-like esterase